MTKQMNYLCSRSYSFAQLLAVPPITGLSLSNLFLPSFAMALTWLRKCEWKRQMLLLIGSYHVGPLMPFPSAMTLARSSSGSYPRIKKKAPYFSHSQVRASNMVQATSHWAFSFYYAQYCGSYRRTL